MKPKRLVVVRFRQDRTKWEVDYLNAPGSTPFRVRRLFATEEEALRHAAQVAPRLDATVPPVQDAAMTLRSAFERYFRLKARNSALQRACGTSRPAGSPATERGAWPQDQSGGRTKMANPRVSRPRASTGLWRCSGTYCGSRMKSGRC